MILSLASESQQVEPLAPPDLSIRLLSGQH
jgi:hypothetical protein